MIGLFFFAGHGETRTGSRGEIGFLVPYDADSSDLSTFIRWDELTRNSELIRAKHMFFIMDACYGGLALSRNIQSGSARFLKDMLLRYSRQVLTAGKANEIVADSGGPIPGHSVFTGHLIEGICGKAATPDGIITASGLMAYVYGKVANDINSRQTPHYGHFEGDGDLILSAPQILDSYDPGAKTQNDLLMIVPYADDVIITDNIQEKIKKCKLLLSRESSYIELHDFAIEELKKFLSSTSDDNFPPHGTCNKEELLERISRYEAVCTDLSLISACISYWGKSAHQSILQKLFSKSTDRLNSNSGYVIWSSLRWFPLIIQAYCAGVAAVDSRRYDSLASIFYAKMNSDDCKENTDFLVGGLGRGILELMRKEIFKQLPGHENNYTPHSEYLFKILQPKLDDALFLGKGYENAFDEFEILLALAIADNHKQNDKNAWGPIGRFGWKMHQSHNSPLKKIIEVATKEGAAWSPLKAGLFGGDFERFHAASSEFYIKVEGLSWN